MLCLGLSSFISLAVRTLLVLIANSLLNHVQHPRDNCWRSKKSSFTARATLNSIPESRVPPGLGKVLHNPDHAKSVFFNIQFPDLFSSIEISEKLFLDDDFIHICLQLLLEHQDAIAPDTNDLLNELLEGLGPVPDVESFLGMLFFVFMGKFTLGAE